MNIVKKDRQEHGKSQEKRLKMKKTLLIQSSGGRSSMFMARLIKEHPHFNREFNLVFAFANTGKEREATLKFVNRCDKEWGLGIVWIEAVITQERGEGTRHKIVTYETADRTGKVFEEMLMKYGIPSIKYPHCTRELKDNAMISFMKSLGIDEFITARGIRADEPHRLNKNQHQENIIYPLVDMNVNEAFIRNWWKKQCFDLELKDYQGNCDLCWKKSKRKRLTMIAEEHQIAEWWQKMETKYSDGFNKTQFDQREGLTVDELIEMAKQPFRNAIDKQELREQNPPLFEPNMDMEWDCFCKST